MEESTNTPFQPTDNQQLPAGGANQGNDPGLGARKTQFYNSLRSAGLTEANIGKSDAFSASLADSSQAGSLYDNLRSAGLTEANIGSKDDFMYNFSGGPAKKKVPTTSSSPFQDDLKNSGIGYEAPKSTLPSVLTQKGASNYLPDQSSLTPAERLSNKLNYQSTGYAYNKGLKQQILQDKAVQEGSTIRVDDTTGIAMHAMSTINQNVLKPLSHAINKSFYGGVHSINQAQKDIYAAVVNGIAGSTVYAPTREDWASKVLENDAADEKANEQTGTGDTSLWGGIKSGASTLTKGVMDAVPLLLGAAMTGGESLGAEAASAGGSVMSNALSEAAKHAIPEALKLGSILGISKGLNAYGEARTAGKSISEAGNSVLDEGAKGLSEGPTIALQNLMGGAIGGSLVTKFTNMGIIRDGKILPSAIRSMANGVVFGTSSLAGDAYDGKDLDYKSALLQFGLGFAFSAPELLNSTGADAVAGWKSLTLAKDASAMETFMRASPQQIAAIHNLPTSSVDLQANATKTGVEAEHTTDIKEKEAKTVASAALQKASGVKEIIEHIIDNKDNFIQKIQDSDLSDDKKKAVIAKIIEVHATHNPIEVEKQSLSSDIQNKENEMSSKQAGIDALKKILEENTDPVVRAETKAHIAAQQKDLQDIKIDHDHSVAQLEHLASGALDGTITHRDGQVIDANNPVSRLSPDQPVPAPASTEVPDIAPAPAIGTAPDNSTPGTPATADSPPQVIDPNATTIPVTDESTQPVTGQAPIENASGQPQEGAPAQGEGDQVPEAPQGSQDEGNQPDQPIAEGEAAPVPAAEAEKPQVDNLPQETPDVPIPDSKETKSPVIPSAQEAEIAPNTKPIIEPEHTSVDNHEGTATDQMVGKDVPFINNVGEIDKGRVIESRPDGKIVVQNKNGTKYVVDPKDTGEEGVKKANSQYVYSTSNGKSEPILLSTMNTVDSVIPAGTFQSNTDRIQVDPIKGVKPKQVHEIIGGLYKSMRAVVLRLEGKLRASNVLGFYAPNTRLTALREAGDIDTAAHEMGHLVSDQHTFRKAIDEGDNVKKMYRDLKELSIHGSQPPEKATAAYKLIYTHEEGIAELIRAHLFNPKETARRYPELIEAYKKSIPKETRDKIEKFGNEARELEGSTAHEQIMSQVSSPGGDKVKGSLFSALTRGDLGTNEFRLTDIDRVNIRLTDNQYIIHKAWKFLSEKTSFGDFQLTENKLTKMIRTFAGKSGKIQSMFDHGLRDAFGNEIIDKETGERLSLAWLYGSLNKANLKKDIFNTKAYMIAKRTIELSDRFQRENDLTGISHGLGGTDRSKALDVIREHEALPEDKQNQIKEAARRYDAFADKLMRYSVDKGRMSEKSYKFIKDNNLHYVALMRNSETEIGSDVEKHVVGGPGGSLGIADNTFSKGIKGSSSQIRDPYESLVELAYKHIVEADRNEIMQTFTAPLLAAHRKMGDGSDVVRLSDIGVSVGEGTKDTTKVWFKGEPVLMKFSPDILRGLNGMDDLQKLPGYATFLGRVLRAGVTKFPAFAIRNFIKDTQERMIKSRSGGLVDDITNLFKDGKVNDEWFDYFGGSQSGYLTHSADHYHNELISRVRELSEDTENKHIILKARDGLKYIWKKYDHMLEENEMVSRRAEFRKAYKYAQGKGLSDYDAGVHAAFEARDLMDFAVGGTWMKQFNQICPFTNAAVQGLMRSGIGAYKDPLTFSAKLMVTLVAPAIANRFAIHALGGDDRYLGFPAWKKDMFYYLGHFGGHDVLVPKPYELALVGAMINRFLDKSVFNDPHAFDGFASNAINVLDPVSPAGVNPLGLKTIASINSNHDFFRDASIVNQDEEDTDIRMRKGAEKATRFSKFLSEMAYKINGTQWDPRYIDFAIKDLTGGSGDLFLKLADLGSNNKATESGLENPFINPASTFTKLLTTFSGVVKKTSVADARDVQYVFNTLKSAGIKHSPISAHLGMMVKNYGMAESDDKDKLEHEIISYAKDIRKKLEEEDIVNKRVQQRGNERYRAINNDKPVIN